MAKHYQFDSKFFIPLIAAFVGSFLAGWGTFKKDGGKFHHLKIGIGALVSTFLFTWCGFSLILAINSTGFTFFRGLAKASTSFLNGSLIMIPAFILLVYLAEEKQKRPDETDNKEEE